MDDLIRSTLLMADFTMGVIVVYIWIRILKGK
jgi:hypothetical protein